MNLLVNIGRHGSEGQGGESGPSSGGEHFFEPQGGEQNLPPRGGKGGEQDQKNGGK